MSKNESIDDDSRENDQQERNKEINSQEQVSRDYEEEMIVSMIIWLI
jgi:hypothetical protein